MNMLSLKIALRYMLSKKSNRSISFFSLISFLGLSVGVSAIIIVLSVMNSFQEQMHVHILGMVPHLSLDLRDKNAPVDLENWQSTAENILAHDSRIKEAAPFVNLEGMIKKDSQIKGLRVSGVLPAFEQNVSVIDEFMLGGRLSSLVAGSNNIILGAAIARDLGLIIGDKINFIMPVLSELGAGVQPKLARFNVSGIFYAGAEADDLFGYIHLEDAILFRNGSAGKQIDGIRFQLKEVYVANNIRDGLLASYPETYRFSTWASQYGQLFQTVKLEKTMTGFMLMLIVLVAAFNIVSSLIMLVSEKHVSIAVLRTMGISPGQVSAIFVFQGFIIAIIGVGLGVLAGVLIALNLENIILTVNQAGVFRIVPLDAKVDYLDVFWISICAALLSVFATILPARRASKIEPADAIRYH